MRLADLQRRFVASLYGEPVDLQDVVRSEGGIGIEDRVAIYRNNLHAGFEKALALEFPVIAALCGPEFFSALARDFQHAHPSVSGDLHHIGGPLPQYLRQRFGDSDYAYFADVAALEWAREESTRAADAPLLDLAALGIVTPEETPALRFAVHPAVRLVASCWPVLSIWEAHQVDGDVRGVDLGAGAEQVLVRRGANGTALERIATADCTLLVALQRGDTLGEAFDAALDVDPAFDVAAALQRCVTRGLLTTVLQAAIGNGAGRAMA